MIDRSLLPTGPGTPASAAPGPVAEPSVWAVGALCRAVADALEARFNPVSVRGEISGFTRAASGHCYFTLKDAGGQLRCVMFRRAASLLDRLPRDGDRVEVRGRLDVYDARGDLQLIAESLVRDGRGSLFEEFLRLKAQLEAEGLFDPARKRPLPERPRTIGLVTSLGAAALHDVATALQRRVPHVAVVLAPAAVQGAQAPGELITALEALYDLARRGEVDVILLVRGGGSLEDLWAFNDERLARALVRAPVPLVCGVGHETDFTIADFCADVRAPTPTAAAELVAQPRADSLAELAHWADQLRDLAQRQLDSAAQRLDGAAARLGRPSQRVGGQRQRLAQLAQQLHFGARARLTRQAQVGQRLVEALRRAGPGQLTEQIQRLERAQVRLQAMDPRQVLARGYALIRRPDGHVLARAAQAQVGESVQALLADGRLDLTIERTALD